MKTSRLQIGPTATDHLSSMLNVFANFFCKIFMFLLLHLLHIKPWPGLVFEEAKATSGQAKAGAFRPSRAGTALGSCIWVFTLMRTEQMGGYPSLLLHLWTVQIS